MGLYFKVFVYFSFFPSGNKSDHLREIKIKWYGLLNCELVLRSQPCFTLVYVASMRRWNLWKFSLTTQKRKILHIQMLVLLLNSYLSMSISVCISLLAQNVKQCVLAFEHLFNEPCPKLEITPYGTQSVVQMVSLLLMLLILVHECL